MLNSITLIPVRLRKRNVTYGLAILLAFAVALWALITFTVAHRIETELHSIDQANAIDIASVNRATIEPDIKSLNNIGSQVKMLRFWLLPLRIGSVLVSWAPWLGDNVTALPNLVDRVAGDINASRELLEGVIELKAAYTLSASAMNDIGLPRHDGAVQARLSKASEHLARADVALQRVETIASTSDPDRYMQILKTYNDSLTLKEIKIRSFVDWASSASETVRHLYDSLTAVSSLLKYLEEGEISSPGHLELLLETLDRVTYHGSAAFDASSRTNLITPENLLGSDIANHLHIVEAATNGLRASAEGASLGLRAVIPALEILESGSAGLLSDGERNLKGISLLTLHRDQLDLAIPLLESGSVHIDKALKQSVVGLDSSLISEVSDAVSLLHSGFRFVRDFPVLADELLGANGPRTYLVLGQTSDELRATGGFVSALWLLTTDRGSLISAEYHDIVEIDNLANLHLYPSPPSLLQQHMNAPVWLMRDVSWEPDFPATAQMAIELFRLGQNRSVDGVMAITPPGLLDIARQIGQIPTPDGAIAANSLMRQLEIGTDRHGRAYLDTIFQGLIEALNNPNARTRSLHILGAIQRALDHKQILVYLTDPALQHAVVRSSWDGGVTLDQGDRVYVVDSNVGWSKVDSNIDRSIHYRVELDAAQPAHGQLNITYANRSNPGSQCGDQWMDRGSTYEVLKNACYWNLFRVYISPGTELISTDPIPLPPGSIFEQLGHGTEGQDTVILANDSAGPSISGLITVEPGSTHTVSLTFQLPNSIIDWTNQPTYSLNLQAQPGAKNRQVTVEIELPSGYAYVSSSIEPYTLDGRTASFKISLQRDIVLTITMQRS